MSSGIFTIPGKRDALAEWLVPTLDVYTNNVMKQQAQQKEQKGIQMLQEQLGTEEYSPIKFASLLAQNPDIRPETKQFLAEANKLQSAQTVATKKATAKSLENAQKVTNTQNKEDADTQHARTFGKSLGLTDEEQEAADVKTVPEAQALQKKLNPKAEKPLGGLGGQPVPPEIAEKMDKIIEENPDASPDVLTRKFIKAAIPREHYKPYLENRREAVKERLDIHRETGKYDEELQKQVELFQKQVLPLEEIARRADNVSPLSITNVFRNFGPLGQAVATAFETPDQAGLKTAVVQLLEGWKNIFGVRLSDADLAILKDKLPDIGKSPETNKEIVRVIKRLGDQVVLRSNIAAEIKKENQGYRPLNYIDRINSTYDELMKEVDMYNPKTGEKKPFKKSQITAAKNAGFRLSNETTP